VHQGKNYPSQNEQGLYQSDCISLALSAGLADRAIRTWTSDLHPPLCVPRKMAYIVLWSDKVLAPCSERELPSFSTIKSLIQTPHGKITQEKTAINFRCSSYF